MKKAFVAKQLFDGEKISSQKAVLIEGEAISGICNAGEIPEGFSVKDLGEGLLAPAFIDIQIYGGKGLLFSEFPSTEALEATYNTCLAGGTTQFLPTVGTNYPEIFFKAIDVIKQYWNKGGKGAPGLHFEGPYINPEKKGAHRLDCILIPTLDEIKELTDHAEGAIKVMTIAPEMCSDAVIHHLQDNNIILSAGHSNATYQQANSSFEKGISLCTHLFNAMSPVHHRAPGLPSAIFNSDKVMASVVADGYHVDFEVIRFSKKIMGERLFLITDAVTESKEGHYQHRLIDNRYVMPDGTLSGSALTMAKAVKNCIEKIDASIEEALRMASLYPAKAIKIDDRYGKIQRGYKADFVLLDNNYNPLKVFTAGREVN